MDVTTINPDGAYDTREKWYSHATRIGDTVLVSGQLPLDENGETVGTGNIIAQVEQVFSNLENVLIASGSSLSRVAKTTTFVTDRDHVQAVRDVRKRVFEKFDAMPASTLVIVKGLTDPDWLVEIEAVAIASD